MSTPSLLCDFHAHSSEDPKDNVLHSARRLVDAYAEAGYQVMALTLHSRVYAPSSLFAYAQKKGVLLIPGVEARITDIAGDDHGCDVVVLNITEQEHRKLKTFDDLRKLRAVREQNGRPLLVFAPHPYYPGPSSLGTMLERNVDCFDAVEYCHFYPWGFNRFNRRAVAFARAYRLPMVGTGDVHHLDQIGHTATRVQAARTASAVIAAVRSGHCAVESEHLPLGKLLRMWFHLYFVSSQKPKTSGR